MAKKAIKFGPGNVFLIPLEDKETYGVGQVIEITKEALNSVICGFYDLRVGRDFDVTEAVPERLIAVQFTTPDLLENGVWPIVGQAEPVNPNDYFDLDGLKANGYIGAEIEGSAIIRKFLSAYFGLIPWNCYYRDDYFDGMMLYPENKPKEIYFEEK